MKNLLLLITALAIVGSSCSSRIGIAKRKYGKGYYVSVSHQPKQPVSKTERTVSLKKAEKEQVKQVIVSAQLKNDENHSVSVLNTKAVLAQTSGVKSALNNSSKQELQANVNSASSITSKKIIKRLDSVLLSNKSKADDTNTILLVILCLFWFLNLIAVYLKQGKKITTDFWITLILDLTFILGVIYAILVVLDVLSFA